MQKIKKSILLFGLAATLLLAGCGLVSMTILLDKEIDRTEVPTSFYIYDVDVTDEDDWIDHEDEIELIDYVGFALHLSNPGETDVTFEGYVDDYDNALCTSPTCAEGKTRILKDITIPAGTHIDISMGDSFAYMENMEALRTLTREGRFHFYGVTSGDASGPFIIESGRVVVGILVSGS